MTKSSILTSELQSDIDQLFKLAKHLKNEIGDYGGPNEIRIVLTLISATLLAIQYSEGWNSLRESEECTAWVLRVLRDLWRSMHDITQNPSYKTALCTNQDPRMFTDIQLQVSIYGLPELEHYPRTRRMRLVAPFSVHGMAGRATAVMAQAADRLIDDGYIHLSSAASGETSSTTVGATSGEPNSVPPKYWIGDVARACDGRAAISDAIDPMCRLTGQCFVTGHEPREPYDASALN